VYVVYCISMKGVTLDAFISIDFDRCSDLFVKEKTLPPILSMLPAHT
jgi:hypothetical protein